MLKSQKWILKFNLNILKLDICPMVTSGMVLQLLEGPNVITAGNKVGQDRN